MHRYSVVLELRHPHKLEMTKSPVASGSENPNGGQPVVDAYDAAHSPTEAEEPTSQSRLVPAPM